MIVILSKPARGLTDLEIIADQEAAAAYVKIKYPCAKVIDLDGNRI